MGDPKKPKNKYSTPRHPWSAGELSTELFLLGTYGLRNKRELWGAQTELSRVRKQARALLAATPEVRERMGAFLIKRLYRLGLTSEGASLDDILSLKVEDLLERRLQSLIWRKGIAKSPYEARQLISHKRVLVGERLVSKPSYLVGRDEEERLSMKGPVQKEVVGA
ncbi:MAG: 30S ribosomal protein S4 [Nitrososphaerota archaeon]|nr:30S ribosomal protein S4 [Nitrososphaerota archaeon]MDG6939528.1 30S ribosomal protein S4 [Nitrososphaerota archaeon]